MKKAIATTALAAALFGSAGAAAYAVPTTPESGPTAVAEQGTGTVGETPGDETPGDTSNGPVIGASSVHISAVTKPGRMDLNNYVKWALNPANWKSQTPASKWGPSRPGIDFDGVFGAQCVDLAKAWAHAQGSDIGQFTGTDGPGRKGAYRGTKGTYAQTKVGDMTTRSDGGVHSTVVLEKKGGKVRVLEQNYGSKSPTATRWVSASMPVVYWRRG